MSHLCTIICIGNLRSALCSFYALQAVVSTSSIFVLAYVTGPMLITHKEHKDKGDAYNLLS